MNPLLLDAAAAAILLISLACGYHRGLILTLAGLIGTFVALFGAIYLSNRLMAPVSELLAPALEGTMHVHMTTLVPELSNEAAADMEAILQALANSPVLGGLVTSLREAMDDTVTQTVDALAAALARQLASGIARVLLFAAAFAVVSVLFHLLARSLDLAFRLPLLNAVNRIGGGLFGLLRGGLLVFVLAWLLEGHFVAAEVVEQTKLFSVFCHADLLAILFGVGLPKP